MYYACTDMRLSAPHDNQLEMWNATKIIHINIKYQSIIMISDEISQHTCLDDDILYRQMF